MSGMVGIEGFTVDPELGSGAAQALVEAAFELQRYGSALQRMAGQLDRRSARLVVTAMSSVGIAATALFAAADTQCTLDDEPADVRTRPEGPNHDMITRCEHDPAHCWDGNGRYTTCP
jgi:hypothetical protein